MSLSVLARRPVLGVVCLTLATLLCVALCPFWSGAQFLLFERLPVAGWILILAPLLFFVGFYSLVSFWKKDASAWCNTAFGLTFALNFSFLFLGY